MDLAVDVVAAVRELVGDHVRHNAYFLHFPEGCRTRSSSGSAVCATPWSPRLLIASVKDRVTVLHLGDTLERETRELYLALAGAPPR